MFNSVGGHFEHAEELERKLFVVPESAPLLLVVSLGMGFTGAVHCEAYSAVLNSLSGTHGPHDGLSENLLAEFQVSLRVTVSHTFVPCSNLTK
jgi:hypothetical protein